MKKVLFILFPLFALLACDSNNSTHSGEPTSHQVKVDPSPSNATESLSLQGLEWMLGKWMQVEKGGAVSYEIWEKKGGAFSGMACTILNGDTIWKEKLDLLVEGTEVIYYANVPENDGPVGFKMTSAEGQKAAFENPKHDFPWQIIYDRKVDTLHARIAGFRDGQAAFNDLYMVLEQN